MLKLERKKIKHTGKQIKLSEQQNPKQKKHLKKRDRERNISTNVEDVAPYFKVLKNNSRAF